jgi:hypothetical protein
MNQMRGEVGNRGEAAIVTDLPGGEEVVFNRASLAANDRSQP